MCCGDSVAGFHVVNILLHTVCVLLLYKLLCKTGAARLSALLLSAIFAVHPLLTTAVAWIPGRNDTLLFVFAMAYFLNAIAYYSSGKSALLCTAMVWLLLALFTKETAIVLLPASLLLVRYQSGKHWVSSCLSRHLLVSVTAIAGWGFAMTYANSRAHWPHASAMLADCYTRFPIITQYLGKALLPVALGVYPAQKMVAAWPGLLAIPAMVALVFWSGKNGYKMAILGVVLFGVLLLPYLFIPHARVNQVVLEHRMYLPMLGLLLVINKTPLVSRYPIFLLIVVLVFSMLNYQRQPACASPRMFWSEAARQNPADAFCHLMLAENTPQTNIASNEFEKAYSINPNLKSLNLRYGVFWLNQDSVSKAKVFLNRELALNDNYICHYYLMKVAAINHEDAVFLAEMRLFISKNPANSTPPGSGLLKVELNNIHRRNNPLWQPIRAEIGL